MITFSLFLLIAATFWLLNALSKEYTSAITYPVEFKNFPEDKVLVGELPEALELKVRGYGFSLMQYKIAPIIRSLTIDMELLPLIRINPSNSYNFYVTSDRFINMLQWQMKDDLNLLDISPDTVYFTFAPVVEKKVPVIANIKLVFDEQYMLSDKITINPDSIIITGPAAILDTIDAALTNEHIFTGLNSDITRNIGLEDIDNVNFSEKRVIIDIPVDKYTEARADVLISIINLPDSIDISLFPHKVSVTYNVSLDQYKQIDQDDFLFVADYLEIEKSLGNKIKVRLEKYPDCLMRVEFYPKSVEYIIRKK
ncbi:MAG: YbbR-like domain-containing protein [Bacteroidota bacterium]